MSEKKDHRLWGGRFSEKTDNLMKQFNDSISYDQVFWKVDIQGSQAYAKGLAKLNILTDSELSAIINGLEMIKQEWENNKFEIQESDEDIHTANERRLKELIGEPASKLHTGRSRNDQVQTDTNLWMKEAFDKLKMELIVFINAFIDRAEKEKGVIFPGYTHLQRAQPVRFSHWILSYAFQAKRDLERLNEIYKRVDSLPLGCGALAGNPFNIDRNFLAKELNFTNVSDNSLDTVGSRDSIVEFLQWANLTGIHLSRFAEDLIIYSTKEFNFVTLSDMYSTGSSLMPQKKNADSLELIRGKSSILLGLVTAMSCNLKALPMTYNKDLQEDKQLLFKAYETIDAILKISHRVLTTLKLNKESCCKALSSEMLATDIAYYLVKKNVGFRDGHEVAGKCVMEAEKQKVELSQLTVKDFQTINDKFENDILNIWNYEQSVEQYKSIGGTALSSIEEQILKLKIFLKEQLK